MSKKGWLSVSLIVLFVLIILFAFWRYPRETDIDMDIQRIEYEMRQMENDFKKELEEIEKQIEELKEGF